MPRHPHTSPTAASLSDAVYSRLAQKARERSGVTYALHVGDTYLEPLPAARAEAQRVADHPRLHNYAPVQGEPGLLAAISKRLGARTGRAHDVRDIQVMSGATGGLAVVCATVLDPGDEVLVLAPFWPLIRGIIASRGAVPVQVPFYDRIGDSSFDPEAALEAHVTERTAALYINTPNNPTGCVLSREVMDGLARFAHRHDLWVLTDEAYEAYWFTDEPPGALWDREDLRGRAIANHTLSKSYGLAGARVGYTHGPHEVMSAIRGVQTFQTYCAPRPMQLAAIRALNEGDEWLAAARRAYREAGFEAARAVGMDPPDGGTFLFFDATPHMKPGEDLFGFLGRCLDAGVLLTPGSACGEAYESWVRLCFTAVPPDALREALGRLSVVLQR